VPRDEAEAFRLTQLAAQQQHAGALSNLATFYVQGRVVPTNYVQAVRLFRQAADQGVRQAQVNLGELLLTGAADVSPDPVEAVRLLRLASEQGSATAMKLLASLYKEGKAGVPKDELEAARLVQAARLQGSTVLHRRQMKKESTKR